MVLFFWFNTFEEMLFYLACIYLNFSLWNFEFFSIFMLSYATNQDFMPFILAQFFVAQYPQKLRSGLLMRFLMWLLMVLLMWMPIWLLKWLLMKLLMCLLMQLLIGMLMQLLIFLCMLENVMLGFETVIFTFWANNRQQ